MLARGHEPSTIYEIPHPFEWPNTDDIIASQKSLTNKETQGAKRGANQLWRTPKGQILIPASDIQMISRICIISHAGSAGHRGTVPTTRAIKLRFSFTNMDAIIKRFIQRCLQCLKSASGKRRPLMFGHQVVAERPGDVLHMDYLFMRADSESGDRHLLVIKNGIQLQQ